MSAHAQDYMQTVSWDIRPFIDGRYVDSRSTESFDDVNPATEEVLCRIPAGSAEDVDLAVTVARRRFEQGAWRDLGPDERKATLLNLARLVVEHKNDLALLDSLEMGKPLGAARFEAGVFGFHIVRSAAELTDKVCGALVPSEPSSLSFSIYEPRGVIGAVVPWNFPTVNTLLKISPALAAGNAVVLKPSEIASGSALRLAELAVQAGLPEGIFNVVPGTGRGAGEALVSHPGVDMVSFTGSTATGRRVMQLAGQSHGRPLQLECGGKSPQLVFADVDDLDRVASNVVQDILYNSGQVCSARSRLLVEESIRQSLLDKIIALSSQFKPGNPLDETTTLGPLASKVQRDKALGYIRRGIADGAEIILGDLEAGQRQKGYFVLPAIFDKVSTEMSIVREEIFGPVLSVQSFTDEVEAIRLANATEYGLAATAWTRDLGRAKRLARRINAGLVVIRTSGEEGTGGSIPNLLALCAEPHKASGFGAEWGLKGLEAYSALKAVQMIGH
jgi:acyl-CoA reductase-like NAD-dependent aldehyde dehydrogenase